MKKLKWLLLAALTACCVALLAGCGNMLSRPEGLKIDETSVTLSWDAVDNATNYVLEIGGKQ